MAGADSIEDIQELRTLVVDYARQETIGPLRSLKRYLSFGLGGTIAIFFGVFFLGLGTLRLAQTFDVFSGGSWGSLGPYAITIVVLALILGLIGSTLNRATKKVK